MRFAQPNFILFFFLAAALVVFYLWANAQRRITREKFAQSGLLPELLAQADPARQELKVYFLIVGVIFCLLALMRPQWGFKWQEVKNRGLDIIIALDTSKSMLAADIKPSRLERAKLAIGDFVQEIKGDRIALIAFSGSAFLECPLTIDYGGFLLSLESLDADTIPLGGTAISSAIREAMRGYPAGGTKDKVLIIITDGEDHEGDPLKLAEEAKKQGIIVYCIGIGTKEGELIFAEGENGVKEFLKDNQGNAVKSRLNEETLQSIALATGGTYVRATNSEFGLNFLYKEKLSKFQKREFQARLSKLSVERFQIFLLAGLLLILLELVTSETRKMQ